MSDNEYTLTQKEAADFLNVSTKSISRYRKRGLPHKLILNPLTGKQEVRFRQADMERWDEGRQLLATYARDGEQAATAQPRPSRVQAPQAAGDERFLGDLLAAYKEQIELLREQLEDMREQLARRDRQIDDLMRLMVGLQLEYKPQAAPAAVAEASPPAPATVDSLEVRQDGLYEVVDLAPVVEPSLSSTATTVVDLPSEPAKHFSRDELTQSIQRLRAKGKSYEEIALGLNRLQVATPSGQPLWTVAEVQNLLPGLVNFHSDLVL